MLILVILIIATTMFKYAKGPFRLTVLANR